MYEKNQCLSFCSEIRTHVPQTGFIRRTIHNSKLIRLLTQCISHIWSIHEVNFRIYAYKILTEF